MYKKTNWQNGMLPAINADNLNNIEKGIEEVDIRTSNLSSYSDDEIEIGQFTSKPIYRKVIQFNNMTSNIQTNISSIDMLLRMDCFACTKNTNEWRSLPWLYTYDNIFGGAAWAGGFFLNANKEIVFQVGTSLADISKGIIILEYTKNDEVI